MKANKESDILDPAFRKTVISEIMRGVEVRARKAEHEKREEVYKDRTREYALRLIQKEMGDEAVLEMQHRVPNLSITRKIVDKKARVYKDRPMRKADNASDQDALDGLIEYLKLDFVGKEINRKVELHKNILVRMLPVPCDDELTPQGQPTWDLRLGIFQPARYDVIEDPRDPRYPLAIVLSYVDLGGGLLRDYRSSDSIATTVASGEEATDRANAVDPKKRRFVWWSKSYHMTTDQAGVIMAEGDLTPEAGVNPLQAMPFIPYSKDQGESYWADGGEGQADNAILINLLLADLNFSAKYQTTGLGFIISDDPPTNVKFGANRFIKLTQKEAGLKPEVGFASPSPKLQEAMGIIEQQLSFFLTTEGLESSAIAGKLDATRATSGIHAVIEKSEPVSAIEDDQQLYKDMEPEVIELACKTVEYLRNNNLPLHPDLAALNLPAELPYTLSFSSAKPVISDSDSINLLIQKQETGLFTELQLLEDAHPDLDEEELKALQAELHAEKAAKAALLPQAPPAPAGGPNPNPNPPSPVPPPPAPPKP